MQANPDPTESARFFAEKFLEFAREYSQPNQQARLAEFIMALDGFEPATRRSVTTGVCDFDKLFGDLVMVDEKLLAEGARLSTLTEEERVELEELAKSHEGGGSHE